MMLRKPIDESSVTRIALYRHFTGKGNPIKGVLGQRQSLVVDSIAEKLGPMPDATTHLKDILNRHGTRFHMPEFAGCLFEHASVGFGDIWPEVTDATVRCHDGLFAVVEILLKDVMSTNTARRLAGVYMM